MNVLAALIDCRAPKLAEGKMRIENVNRKTEKEKKGKKSKKGCLLKKVPKIT